MCKIQIDGSMYDVDTSIAIEDFINRSGLSPEKAAFLYEIASKRTKKREHEFTGDIEKGSPDHR